jgi:hypothetical protein
MPVDLRLWGHKALRGVSDPPGPGILLGGAALIYSDVIVTTLQAYAENDVN